MAGSARFRWPGRLALVFFLRLVLVAEEEEVGAVQAAEPLAVAL
jgi:hypothetical protein